MANQENKSSYIASLLNSNTSPEKKPPHKESESDDLSFLVINSVAHVKGDIISDGDVVVDGILEGRIKARNLKITKNGRVIGEINVKSAEIAGSSQPEITCSERLTVKETGRVTGVIFTKELVVNIGGKLLGTLQEYVEVKDDQKVKNVIFK